MSALVFLSFTAAAVCCGAFAGIAAGNLFYDDLKKKLAHQDIES